MNPKIIFFILLILSATGFISPPIALCAGIIFGLAVTHPYSADSKALSKFLLQASIVALGFGMNLHEVLKAGKSGFLYTFLGITFAMLVGLGIGKLLTVRGTTSYLISTGTAICGGSAIAAVGPVLHASEEEMAVSLGTVFILNSIALFIFPVIGKSLGLSQSQFGLWSALAIHDTSSVVGAASRYGTQSLIIATTVKLARALWIVPLAFVTAAIKHGKSKVTVPWFILFFFLAAVINTYGPQDAALSQKFFTLGKLGLTATLFLIGTSISKSTLKEVGWRPLVQGVLLWLVVGSLSLYFIRLGWIAISGTF
ncbi:MAG TPA: putative sulfate exporter family transporter [Candidatus Acidoferrum sp.]|nr:putative sulfate exporter family transporter [Candidatus Acidoferrum sp.]